MKMGHIGPPLEPRRRLQAGMSGDPRSQNADSFSLEEERVMQQSRVSISLSFENQGINLVGDNAQSPEYLHKQTPTCTQHDKGVVNPFTVICKARSDIDG